MSCQCGARTVKVKRDISLVWVWCTGIQSRWSRASFPSPLPSRARERGTRDPLKRVIKAQQDEAQLAISVTPSTCSKQMVRERETEGESEREREAEVSRDPLNWSDWLPSLPVWEAAILIRGHKLNEKRGWRHVASLCDTSQTFQTLSPALPVTWDFSKKPNTYDAWQTRCWKWLAAVPLSYGVVQSCKPSFELNKKKPRLLDGYKDSQRAALQDFTEWHNHSSFQLCTIQKSWCVLTSLGHISSPSFPLIKGWNIELVKSYK